MAEATGGDGGERRPTGHTRRAFLKGLGFAVGAGGGALSGGCAGPDLAATFPLKTAGIKPITTVCPFCGVGCGQVAYRRGDKVFHVEGDPDHPISEGKLCSKGAALSQISNNKRRLTKVLYRAPGAAQYEEKTWDWAIERIASRVKETRDATFQRTVNGRPANRTDAIACLGGAALDTEECYLLVKAMRAMGIAFVENQARI